MWPLLLTSLVAAGVPLVPSLLTPSMASLEDLLSLFSTLSKAHLGYLHWVRAFLRCSFSCLSNSGLLHTVLALWERVLITLNLAERLWWLSDCRYWSVWVGFLRLHFSHPFRFWACSVSFAIPHIRCCLSAIPSDLMKSIVVDESLSSMNLQFCSRENQLLQLLQQNEKPTSIYYSAVYILLDGISFLADLKYNFKQPIRS